MGRSSAGRRLICTIIAIFLFLLPVLCFAAQVTQERAHQVVRNFLKHHQSVYGKWADAKLPSPRDVQVIEYEGMPVAFNFTVEPQGHVLVPCWDEFSPILLYSTTSTLDPERVNEPGSVESWIIPEIYRIYNALQTKAAVKSGAISHEETRVGKAWKRFGKSDTKTVGEVDGGLKSVSFTEVGPLLTTQWAQGDPYNLYCPGVYGGHGEKCDHCVTGCVATAFAQVVKYWNWPDVGEGSHSYVWKQQLLSADFNHEYYWDLMPDELTADSSEAEKDAVARLMADMGVATEMSYSCSSSGSNAYADDVLDLYFKYRSDMEFHDRYYYNADEFFALYKAEFDADPPRVVSLSMWELTGGGHEVVADGYQTGYTNYIHINMGWSGSYNGWYDVTNNFYAGWTWDYTSQIIITHILPENVTSIESQDRLFSYTGGTGTVEVRAPEGSSWTAVSGDDWITVTSGASGSGDGTVEFTVAESSNQLSRTGTMTIAEKAFSLEQEGYCTFSIVPETDTFDASGGTGGITVTADSGCDWTASSNNTWITVTSGASGTGNGTVGYSVDVNGSADQRTGTITVAGETF